MLKPIFKKAQAEEHIVDQEFSGEYTIPLDNFNRLKDAISHINKVIDKLNILYPDNNLQHAEIVSMSPVEYIEHKQENIDPDSLYFAMFGNQKTYVIPVVTVVIKGSAPRLKDWQFIAKILHGKDDTGKFINTFVGPPGHATPDIYKNVGPACEHCGLNRNRKDTFVLHHPQHGYKQVGSACLADFFGHKSPQQIANYLSMLSSLDDQFRNFSAITPRTSDYFGGEDFDTITTFLVDQFGFVSRKQAEANAGLSTSDIAKYLIGAARPSDERKKQLMSFVEMWNSLPQETKDNYRKMGDEARQVAKALVEKEGVSDFEWNLGSIAARKSLEPRVMGYRAYIPEFFRRLNAPPKEKDVNPLNGIPVLDYGPVGSKFENVVKLNTVKPVHSQFGSSMMHKFVDSGGKDLVYFASGDALGEPGEIMKITGTIKKFDSFNGKPQVMITRVKRIS